MRLGGAHAIVTGGSSGIGLATAVLLARSGARVSLVARDPQRLAAAAARVGAGTLTAGVDVADAPAVTDAFETLVVEQGPCDVLVACAGSSHPGYFARLDLQVFRDQMDVNYFGTLYPFRAVTAEMVSRGRGTLVGVSSTAGLLGVFGFSAYSPSKYAVRGLCDVLRAELRGDGVHVACVYPPDTETPGFRAENLIKPPETAAVSGTIRPVGAEKVAAAIVRGIEREQAVITADPLTALLARVGGALAPVADRVAARRIGRLPGRS